MNYQWKRLFVVVEGINALIFTPPLKKTAQRLKPSVRCGLKPALIKNVKAQKQIGRSLLICKQIYMRHIYTFWPFFFFFFFFFKKNVDKLEEKKKSLHTLHMAVLVRLVPLLFAHPGWQWSAMRCGVKKKEKGKKRSYMLDWMRRKSPNICSLEWNYEAGRRVGPLVVWGLGHQSPIAPYLDIYSSVYDTV